MTALNKQALEHLTRKLTRRLNDAYGFSRTSKGKHTTITLSIGECRELIYAIESAEKRAEAAEKRIAKLDVRAVSIPEVRITVAESMRKNLTLREFCVYNEGADVAKEVIIEAIRTAGIGVKVE